MQNTFDRSAVRDRWTGILPQLGIPPGFLNGRNQPCLLCGGKDRARYTNFQGDGCYFCNRCGTGDGVDLIMKVNGWTFPEARERIERLIGSTPIIRRKLTMDHRKEMNAMWRAARPITLDDPAGRYLHRRCGITEFPPCLRYASRLKYWGDPVRWFPGMLAMVSGPDGKPAILHRTFLTPEGDKAPVEAPRRIMPGQIPKGAAIRLAEATDTLGIAEGIETAISATALSGLPVWATISTGIMAGWNPPAGVTRIVIFGDGDANYAGQAAAYGLAFRLSTVPNLVVEVRIPGQTGADWNDVHKNGAVG